MAVFLAAQEGRQPRDEVVARHPDLSELLGLLFDDAACEPAADELPVFGDYRVTRELGRGGMGIVYEASQRSLGRRVAVKVLGVDSAPSPSQIARFRREALVLARLDHPHVVRVFDVGETAGQHWLAMDLVEGESLDRRLATLREAGGHEGASLRDLVQAIATIAPILTKLSSQVRISGHTAAGAIYRNPRYGAWDLSSDRANVVRSILGEFGLSDDHVSSVTGRASSDPLFPNDPYLAGNERVEITVLYKAPPVPPDLKP